MNIVSHPALPPAPLVVRTSEAADVFFGTNVVGLNDHRRPESGRILPENVRVGLRHRKDLGKLDELAASIDELELLQPIVVTPQSELIAGVRRLAAWALTRQAGKPIPCRVVDLEEIVRGEAAENLQRKDFTPSEAVAIARALRPLEEAKARRRQKEHGGTAPGRKHSGRIHPSETGRVRDIVARKVGMSWDTLEQAEAVVAAAEAEPERFGKLLADMDRTGRVSGPHNRLVVARKADAIKASPPPLPTRGPYYAAVLDVPWPYEIRMEDPSHRAVLPYPTMSLDQIRALGPMVRKLMHENSVLWFWFTNTFMEEACQIVREWGFEKKTVLTWGKETIKMGTWLRGQTEHCIVAVRGRAIVTLTNQSTLLLAPSPGPHSGKPDAFYELVQSLCPAPRYLEFFQRKARPNWDGYGDEAGEVRDA